MEQIEQLKTILTKIQNKQITTFDTLDEEYAKINFNIDNITNIEDLEQIEQLLLKTKISYINRTIYQKVLDKIKFLQDEEYATIKKENKEKEQKEKEKEKEQKKLYANIFLEKINNLQQTTKENIYFLTFKKKYKIYKDKNNKIKIKEKNKNLYKNLTINEASNILASLVDE